MRALALLVAFLAVALGVVLVGRWEAARAPVWRVETVALPGLDRPLSVVLAADFHAGPIDMPRARVERIVDAIAARDADLVLLGGDYHGGKLVDGAGVRLEDALEPLARLRAPLGVYAVTGNHDYRFWTAEVMGRSRWPMLLRNEAVDLGPLWLVGLDSIFLDHDPAAARRQLPAEPGKPVVMLMHEPEAARHLGGFGAELALAAHTHGGQVLLAPLGAPIEWVHGRFLCRRGWCDTHGVRLFVTSGVGTSVLPMRIGVRPELVELRLVPAAGPAGRPATAPGRTGSMPG